MLVFPTVVWLMRSEKGRDAGFDQLYLHANLKTRRGEEARGTSLLCALADCIWGTLGWKRIKTPREAFHLPLCRYSGMAEMSAETPPVLLSFSCSDRTGGERKWCRGAKAKFVSSAKTLFYHDTPRLTNLTGNNWFCPFSQKAGGSWKQWRDMRKGMLNKESSVSSFSFSFFSSSCMLHTSHCRFDAAVFCKGDT